ISTSDLKMEDNGRKSSSVKEIMMTAAYEKTRTLEKSTDDSSNETVSIVEGKIVTDKIQEISVNDHAEHATIKGKIIDTFMSWYFYSSLSSAHLKKKTKDVPSARTVSSQYLGTLKVLQDKHEQNGTQFDKADSLRAAVFQNWLKKKRAFLLESKRIEKEKAEYLRKDTEKKEAVKREEAVASFEAWKKKKRIEAKKLSDKKKLEELKKNETAEPSEEKTKAAQKVSITLQCLVLPFHLYRNEKKEEYIKQKKAEKVLERRKQEIQQAKMEERDKKAAEEYERWL
ncbi:MAP9 protein, partial [Piaya cayana]|nr:MAP9 protein [Piaya cayana]